MGVLFISHSSLNNDVAIQVRDWLRDEGYTETFLDLDPEHGLAPGQRWEEELHKAGERCSGIVILVSPEWVSSKWCFHEFLLAKALGKKIFPVIIKPTPFDDLPREMHAHYQFADMSSPEIKDDGLNRLRIGLRRAGLDPTHFTWPPYDEPNRSPYPGLRALTEQDAAVFFGREAQITSGLDKLRLMRISSAKRILTIAAASGAGKSSFLKAGLLARLRRDEENFLVLPTVRPGREALQGASGIFHAFGLNKMPRNDAELNTALESLQEPVMERFQNLAAHAGETYELPSPALVLPIDQAEEFFSSDNATGASAIRFLERCLAVKPDLIAILTVRSDSLGALQSNAGIANQLELFNLPALQPSGFKEVIEGPAALAEPPIKVDPALTERLILDLDRADALPLLAVTMERLTTDHTAGLRLELHQYTDGLGGVSGTINAAVESAFAQAEIDSGLPNTRYELDLLARALFIPKLVQLDEADASPKRRVARQNDLPEASRPLIEHFIMERLLIRNEVEGEPVVEVSHEAVLRHWRGLAEWIGEERSVLIGLQRIIRSAEEWGSNNNGPGAYSESNLLVHRGDRLAAAEAYFERTDLADDLSGLPTHYLKACRDLEDAQITKAKVQAERELKQERRSRRLRSVVGLVTLFAFCATMLGGYFVFKGQHDLGASKSLALARMSQQAYIAEDFQSAARLSVMAVRQSGIAQASPESIAQLTSAGEASRQQAVFYHSDFVRGAVFSDDERRILSWSKDGTLRLWDSVTGEQIGPAMLHSDVVRGALFSRDERRILSWSQDGALRLWNSANGSQIGLVMRHDDVVMGAVFSGDERRILSWGDDRTARLWDSATGAQIGPSMQHNDLVSGAVFSGDERRILTWSWDKTVRLWDSATGQQIGPDIRHGDMVGEAVFSRDERRILSRSADDTVRLWDSATGEQMGPSMQHDDSVIGVVFSGDERRILSWSGDGTLRLWDSATGVQIGPAMQHDEFVMGAAFSSDERRILSWSNDHTLRLWDSATGEQIGPSMQHDDLVMGAIFSSDERQILSWSDDNTVRLWDSATGLQMGLAMQHGHIVEGAVFSHDNSRILSWSRDETVRLWDRTGGEQIGPTMKHDGFVDDAVFSADERNILSWSNDHTLRLWDSVTGEEIVPAMQHSDDVYGAVFSADERRILSWSKDGTLRLWGSATGAQIVRTMQHSDNVYGAVYGAVFSGDEHRILSWGDGTLRLWDSATGAQIGPTMKVYGGSVGGAAFSRDERLILSRGHDMVQVWDIHTGEQLGQSMRHDDIVLGAVFSGDERRILSWGHDGTLRLWDSATGEQIGPAMQHNDEVYGAVLSDDERRILSWSRDHTVRLWDSATGAQIGPAMQHSNEVYGAVWSGDERRILSRSTDDSMRLWDSATGTQIGSAILHEGDVRGAEFSSDGYRILSWSDEKVRIWDSISGAQIGPAMSHEDTVVGAVFSEDENRILSWSWDGAIRIWDVEWSKHPSDVNAYIRRLCDEKLRGQETHSTASDIDGGVNFITDEGTILRSPRRLTATDIEIAPILRGLEGQDVCEIREPGYRGFQRGVASFLFGRD